MDHIRFSFAFVACIQIEEFLLSLPQMMAINAVSIPEGHMDSCRLEFSVNASPV